MLQAYGYTNATGDRVMVEDGCNATEYPTAPKRKPVLVNDRIEVLAKMQEELHRAACELGDRLTPVLRNEPEGECDGDKCANIVCSVPLAERIDRQIARTSGTIRVIGDILERLEV